MGSAVGAGKSRELGLKWVHVLGKRIRLVDPRSGVGYRVAVVGEKFVYGHHLLSVSSKADGEAMVYFRVSEAELETVTDD